MLYSSKRRYFWTIKATFVGFWKVSGLQNDCESFIFKTYVCDDVEDLNQDMTV